MHAIYIRALGSRRPGVALAVDIEDAGLAERLVRGIACSYPRNGHDETASTCWFRDARGLHAIWSEPARGAAAADRGAASAPSAARRPPRRRSSAA